MLVLGTNIRNLSMFSFHGLQASAKQTKRPAVLSVARVLNITLLPRPALISKHDDACRSSQKRQKQSLCYHAYPNSTGMLTCFPFSFLLIEKTIRIDLPLTELHCQGTLALSATVILTLLCSYSRQDYHYCQIHISSRTCFHSDNTPAYRTHY